MKIHVKLNAHCQIKRTSFPRVCTFNLTNVRLVFQVTNEWLFFLLPIEKLNAPPEMYQVHLI